MADETNIHSQAATYSGLISLLKWGAVAAFIVAALVIWLIAPVAK